MRTPVTRIPVIVGAPYPTMLETAKRMGESPARARELEKIVDEIHARNEKKRKAQSAMVRSRQPQTA
jgi:hypothetical protein